MRTTLLAFCFLLIAVSSTTAADPNAITLRETAQWNQWRGPHRDGVWAGELPKSLSELSLAWERPLSPSYSGPITDGKVVYTTETVDEKFERVTALDLATGEPKWTTRWDGAIKVPPYAAANGSWIKSTPALAEDALIVVGIRDELICLDPETGEKRWQIDLSERFGSERPHFGAVCSPIIEDGAVYVQGGGATLKLSLADGSTIWKTLDSDDDDDAFSSPIIATIAGVKQLVVQTRLKLCGVSVDDGKVLWSEPIEAYRNMNVLTPTIIGDSVFTAAHSGRSQFFDLSRSGDQWQVNERWNQKVQAYMSSPVVFEDTIYLHSKNERLTAMDTHTGDILWTGTPMGKYQSLVRNEDVMLVLDESGELLSVNLNRDELEILDRRRVANDSWAYLAVIENGLIIRDLNALKVFRW